MIVRKITSIFVLILTLFFAAAAQAQTASTCVDDNSVLRGFKIRAVKVDARYADISLPPKGASYEEATRDADGGQSKILEDVKKAISDEQKREDPVAASGVVRSTLNQVKGELATAVNLKFVTQCIKIVPPETCEKEVGQKNCLDIHVYAKSLRFDPNNPAQTLLDAVPRSSSTTFLSNVPKPLLALNPEFGTEYDKGFGLSQNLELSTNLADLGEIFSGESVEVKSYRVDVSADAKKSIENPFYETNVGIAVSKFLPSKYIEKVNGRFDFSASRLPNGDASFFQNSVSVAGGVQLKPGFSFLNTVILEGGYSRQNNRFINDDNTAGSIRTKEDDLHFRALINSQIMGGVLRTGFWADSGKSTDSAFSYRRFAGLIGYAKDFGKGNQTFGLETMFGTGKVSGTIPEYAYFYGSNKLKNFIYEANDSSLIREMPAGPLIRSFGSGQAAGNAGNVSNGSRSYWHFNLNLSIPVKQWSRPLIPNEPVELDVPNPNCPIVTIRDLIKCQAASGETILGAIYKKQGVNDFQEKARKEFKGINSAIRFLTDHANLFSVKPLFMFDAASFNSPSGVNKTRFGVGGGMQLTIVIAKFEAGYMRTVNPQVGDSRGNFIMRLYFQNLF